MCLDLNKVPFFNCYIRIRGDLLTDGPCLLRSNSKPKGAGGSSADTDSAGAWTGQTSLAFLRAVDHF